MRNSVCLIIIFFLTAFNICLSAIDVPTSILIPISVSITGDVSHPGVYTLSNQNRLSDAVTISDQMTETSINPQTKSMMGFPDAEQLAIDSRADSLKAEHVNYRNVILIRQGKRQSYDLQKFFRAGDIGQNPLLNDGDVLFIQPVHETITLEGRVIRPGEYEYRSDDTLKDILDLALGFHANADLKHTLLYRYSDDYLTFTKKTLDLSGFTQNPELAAKDVLRPGDRIMVPINSEFRKAYKVSVTGKVKNPGVYYVDDNTTIYDLLSMCGGPTNEADLNSAFLYNKLKSEDFDPDFDRLKEFSMTQMTWIEYSYLRTKIRQLKGKYSADIKSLWETQGKESRQILRDGDELVIPEAFNAIWVTGQVKHPGIVEFKPGMIWKDYIASAGGYTNNRKFQGARIIRAYSGNWVKPTDKTVLRPGDTIFVPEREEVTVWAEVKEVILFASQVLTVILTLKTLNAF